MTDLATLRDRYLTLIAAKADIDQELEEIKAALRDTLDVGEHAAGDGHVTLSVTRRFDPAAFANTYPATSHPQFYKLAPDTAAVKKGITPDEYESFSKVVGNPTVRVS